MTELKTLKDIDIASTTDDIDCFYDCGGNVEEDVIKLLKQEAIKWIKEYDLYMQDKIEKRPYGMDAYTKMWIKHFFNITDEDLK